MATRALDLAPIAAALRPCDVDSDSSDGGIGGLFGGDDSDDYSDDDFGEEGAARAWWQQCTACIHERHAFMSMC